MKIFAGILYCLHGFLGLPSDWADVLPEEFYSVRSNLFDPSELSSQQFTFKSLSDWLHVKAESEKKIPKILVGYSLGGRIALNALIDRPTLWSAAVIISAHPGLANEEEKDLRRKADERWAKRFEGDPWESVISDWNSQPVFKDTQFIQRQEKDFSRKALANSLRNCSLGRQGDLRGQISNLKMPILWVVGEKDTKFLSIAKEVEKLNPNISLVVLPNSGHRAPWDQPVLFKQRLISFMREHHLTF